MNTISLCGNPKCCPRVEEDETKGTITIVDGDKQIPFTKEQIQKLTEYLNKRQMIHTHA